MNLFDITVAYMASGFLFTAMVALAALLRVWQ